MPQVTGHASEGPRVRRGLLGVAFGLPARICGPDGRADRMGDRSQRLVEYRRLFLQHCITESQARANHLLASSALRTSRISLRHQLSQGNKDLGKSESMENYGKDMTVT